MTKSFDLAVAFMQLFLLILWEGLGAVYFGWPPLAILLVWVVGIWTLNIGTATVLRTYLKLTQPSVELSDNVVPLHDVGITEEDGVG